MKGLLIHRLSGLTPGKCQADRGLLSLLSGSLWTLQGPGSGSTHVASDSPGTMGWDLFTADGCSPKPGPQICRFMPHAFLGLLAGNQSCTGGPKTIKAVSNGSFTPMVTDRPSHFLSAGLGDATEPYASQLPCVSPGTHIQSGSATIVCRHF